MMIPKKIHYCWFGRCEMPELTQKCIASWHPPRTLRPIDKLGFVEMPPIDKLELFELSCLVVEQICFAVNGRRISTFLSAYDENSLGVVISS